MAVRYVCCQCDADMTDAVQNSCSAGPILVPTLTLKGASVIHSEQWVTLTCPNKHTCSYPCSGMAHHE
jgi:hypothetical protein